MDQQIAVGTAKSMSPYMEPDACYVEFWSPKRKPAYADSKKGTPLHQVLTVTGTIADMHVRTGTKLDLLQVMSIQCTVPEASQWDPSGYELLVAESEGAIAAFLVWRKTAPDEVEVLNLAVLPQFRRRGMGSALIEALPPETVFLEVRESNAAAIALYSAAGFQKMGIRSAYYSDPVEGAVMMRLDRGVVRIPVTEVFDFHTVAPRDVEAVTEAYLEEAHSLGLRALRLIHGRGIGVQRETVRRVLARTSYVMAFCDAPPEAGGWGATVVTLAANENHAKPT